MTDRPGLDLGALLADPARAADVPADAIAAVLTEVTAQEARLGTVKAILAARLATSRPVAAEDAYRLAIRSNIEEIRDALATGLRADGREGSPTHQTWATFYAGQVRERGRRDGQHGRSMGAQRSPGATPNGQTDTASRQQRLDHRTPRPKPSAEGRFTRRKVNSREATQEAE